MPDRGSGKDQRILRGRHAARRARPPRAPVREAFRSRARYRVGHREEHSLPAPVPFHHDRVSSADFSALRLAGLGLSAMLIPLGSTMIAVALPSIGTEFARA